MRRRDFVLPSLVLSLATGLAGCSAASDDHADGDTTPLWEEAFQQTEFGKADSSGCSGVVVPDKNGFAKRVALTFDDGPNPETTPQVLDILKAHGIRGTFFINGMRVTSDAARGVLARELAEGHILANHSQHHLNLKTVGQSKLDSEVKQTHDIILAAGGTPAFFRFPFGSANCSGISLVEGYGYHVTGWHIDSADWCFASGGGYCKPSTFQYVDDQYRHDMVGYVMKQLTAKNGGVVLFHDIHQNTASHLEEIITKLENAGFTFVGVDDTGTFPLLNGELPAPTPFVGDPCKSDADCGFSDSGKNGFCYLYTPSGSSTQSGFCSLPCEGFCPDKGGKAPTFCTSLDNNASGSCVSKADTVNGDCSKIPGTSAQPADRFIGSSPASPSTADVCLPQ